MKIPVKLFEAIFDVQWKPQDCQDRVLRGGGFDKSKKVIF
jgi:hypothetical protein